MPTHTTPLAESLRPKTLDEYIGQQHLIGKGAILRNSIEGGKIPSMILWGPPGVGKTTLATIISNTLNRPFYVLSAISSGVKDVREVIERAKQEQDAILFIDEIHRFNKSQQDSLLGAVEKGIITLIGATTENPSFEVISALLSRCQVYILKSLEKEDLELLLSRAVEYIAEHYHKKVILTETQALLAISGGDARKLLNAIDLTISSDEETIEITNKSISQAVQQNLSMYDKNGEMHYDIISAFIKSIRGSDPNAAVYWLARMISSGESPTFIARRLLILASEDIGNANPNALLLANACFDSVTKIGYPECRIVLSQTTVYLATSPKSNSTYMAMNIAMSIVEQTGDLPVPLHLRNAPTKLMKDIGYGKDYKYAHDYENNFVEQDFLPEGVRGTILYQPGANQKEEATRKMLREFWKNKYNY